MNSCPVCNAEIDDHETFCSERCENTWAAMEHSLSQLRGVEYEQQHEAMRCQRPEWR